MPPVVREGGEDSEPDEEDEEEAPFALHVWGHAEGVPITRNEWNEMKGVRCVLFVASILSYDLNL